MKHVTVRILAVLMVAVAVWVVGGAFDTSAVHAAVADSDGDGICNRGTVSELCKGADLCPSTPATQRPVDQNGCSQQQVDSDMDGVCNRGVTSSLCYGADLCPRYPAPATINGCPGGPPRGAYVTITRLAPDELNFTYGWNDSSAFASAPVGYWIGVYDVTDSHYEWSQEVPLNPAPKVLKLSSLDETPLVAGHSYTINFFVRGSYAPTTNVAVLQVHFIAP